jgi:tetratricopeptide (TPR) repeat protein
MTQVPSPEQHRALLSDCWDIARALPDSGVLDRARQPYRARRFTRKLDSVAHDPVELLKYVRGMARRTSEGFESLVEYNRLDLSVETLIIDESKLYGPLFSTEDRAAAKAKLDRQAREVEVLDRDRAQHVRDKEAAIRSRLPEDVEELRTLASKTGDPDEAIAINESILDRVPTDVVALNRLGRAWQEVGLTDQARQTFQRVLELDPRNQIAAGRLRKLRP